MVLITGFEPFTTGQGVTLTHNPTADIVRRVGEGLPHVRAEVLPVSFSRTRVALLRHFATYRPRVWIGLGYAPHRTTLDVETVALNLEHATRGDNDGERPWMRAVVEGAPLAYTTRLDMKASLAILAEQGAPAHAAFHAGTFLCNQSFYLGCHACETGDLNLAAFIHVPPLPSYDPLERGLSALIDTLTEA